MAPALKSMLSDKGKADTVPIQLLTEQRFLVWQKKLSPAQRKWMAASGFKAKKHRIARYAENNGKIAGIVFGLGNDDPPDIWAAAKLAESMEAGRYRLESQHDAKDVDNILLGWCLEQYRFDRYKKVKNPPSRIMEIPDHCDREALFAVVENIFLIRDLVNTPANDMGPSALARAAGNLATQFDAKIATIIGDKLLQAGFPAIHAVGRAASDAPRLIDFTWGDEKAPKVTLVGKGVCFDTGGLNIKSTAGMRLMKKDMGGAAHVLGLAGMIMALDLPVRLRVLIPAVENNIAGNAYRPGDVLQTRAGLSVEITNTDAEGRLVLADALTLADEEKPDLLLDFATLTGAARVALGADLPALYAGNDALAKDLLEAGMEVSDPLWQLPLWPGYEEDLKSPVADLLNAAETSFAGSITAALFLQNFVKQTHNWVHIDLYAWNQKNRPGRPRGGEAMTVRAVLHYLRARFPTARRNRHGR